MKHVFIDLDGTLLNNEGEISACTINVLKESKRNGFNIFISTGRSYQDAKHLINEYGLKLPIISSNGAQINTADGDKIYSRPLKLEQSRAIIEFAEERHLYFEVYIEGCILTPKDASSRLVKELRQYHTKGNDPKRQEYAERQLNQRHILEMENISQFLMNQDLPPLKVLVFSFNGGMLSELHSQFSNKNMTITSSCPYNVEFTNMGVSKGKAIYYLYDLLGIALPDTVAIGDSMNDYSMFQSTGLRIAMENAHPSIKEQSDMITKCNNEDGVAYALEQLVVA
ncbi:Cof-type HAD-IIB family hydrolase [Heyndrickxia acidicola]|uniref:Cof-type HAD-IIB family hydrolase n=1 Tax=Heyndrickxia acidicola TaxID=209389 RepID=A0ABU6MD53_9BACI|nr:Cof-type HAD-IIB family hydrolase [Heyndrickxia acidicola]MED1202601.1 Cof-type HAD-IIB family hydrolase [Heyndrickxia acidicola]